MKNLLVLLFSGVSLLGFSQGFAPSITTQPTPNQTVCSNSYAYISIVASRATTYQWYSSPPNTALTDGSVYTGTTTANLTVNTAGGFGGGLNFYCVVRNGYGSTTSQNGTLTIQTVSAPTTTNGSSCGPAAITLTATGGNPGSYYWYDAGGNLVSARANGTYTTPVLSATATYSVRYISPCTSPLAYATATINPVPAGPSTSGDTRCGPGVVNLTASGGSPGQYKWYAGGAPVPGQTSGTYSPSISNTTTWLVSITVGTCEGPKVAVTGTVNSVPAAPSATGDVKCGPSQVNLIASGGSAGQYRWYTSGGVAISGQTNATYSPTISTTTSYSVSINNGLCESARTPVTGTINTIPPTPATSGGSNCGPGAVTLTASNGSAGQYRWYTAGGVLITGQTNATYSPTVSSTTSYNVSINNGSCEGATAPVTATINAIPGNPTPTGDAICGPGTVSLNATGGSSGQYRWYTSGGALISGQTNSNYSPSISSTTSYSVSINNGLCESSLVPVTGTVNAVPATPTASGGAICGPGSVTLTATGGSPGQYRWYTAASVAIGGQTNSSYTTPSLSTTTNYLVSINNGSCEGAKASVTASINSVPGAPGASSAPTCGPGSVTLNATGAAPGQYRWYNSGGGLIAGETNSAYTTPSLSSTTNYSVSINNGCEGPQTPVTAIINSVPAQPSASGNSSCGPASLVLNATGAASGQYRWYTSGGAVISGETNSSYSTPVLGSTTNFYVAINNGLCESSRAVATATINGVPPPPGTSGNYACGPATVTLGASGGSDGLYRWYSGGSLIAGAVNSTYTTPFISTTTSYTVSITNGICESSQSSVTATISTQPSPPGTAGASSCTPAALTLSASGASNGQYQWYTSNGVQLTNEVNSTYTTPVLSSSTQYYVTIINGLCESAKTSVVAQINSASSSPVATGGSSCGPGTVSLSAVGANDGQYRWYTTASGGSAVNGATNGIFITPSLTTTTTYYVSVDNGACESGRTAVEATVRTIPTAPTATGGSNCTGLSVDLKAAGGADGQYRWYATASGGVAIEDATGSMFTTPDLTTTTTFYVAINDGVCESVRTSAVATITTCKNDPPVIKTVISLTVPGGMVTVNLINDISDPDNNLDYSTLRIIKPPSSGAVATIDEDGTLTVDYSSTIPVPPHSTSANAFAGTDSLTIGICDADKACTQQVFTIDVDGNIVVYHGISPNNDKVNDYWIIGNIQALADTKLNHVSIFDRWGDLVFEADNYNNTTNVFSGVNKSGNDVPTGVYFYKIEYSLGRKPDTGYLSVKR